MLCRYALHALGQEAADVGCYQQQQADDEVEKMKRQDKQQKILVLNLFVWQRR